MQNFPKDVGSATGNLAAPIAVELGGLRLLGGL